jgi:hypothetical protein
VPGWSPSYTVKQILVAVQVRGPGWVAAMQVRGPGGETHPFIHHRIHALRWVVAGLGWAVAVQVRGTQRERLAAPGWMGALPRTWAA